MLNLAVKGILEEEPRTSLTTRTEEGRSLSGAQARMSKGRREEGGKHWTDGLHHQRDAEYG